MPRRLGAARGLDSTRHSTLNTQLPPSQHRPAQDEQGGGEVDDEAGDIDQRGDEGRGGSRGVDAAAAQEQREHRAGDPIYVFYA